MNTLVATAIAAADAPDAALSDALAIALEGGDMPGFHHTTTVVIAFPV